MKVRDLIEKLQGLDPEKLAVTHGYEGGYEEIVVVEDIRLKLNVNGPGSYYGPHEKCKRGGCCAVLIAYGGRQDVRSYDDGDQ